MPRTTPGSGALLRPYFNSDYGIEKIEVLDGGVGYAATDPPKIEIDGTMTPVTEGVFFPVITGIGTIADIVIFNSGLGYYPVFSTTTASDVVVERGAFGSIATSHTVGSGNSVYTGDYNIVDDTIYFTDAPYGKTGPIGLETGSTFAGRLFSRKMDPYDVQDKNVILDDLSLEFTGIAGTQFSLTENLGIVSALYNDVNTGVDINNNPFVLINNVVQTPGADFEVVDSTENKINFLSGVPRAGRIVKVGLQTGSGYYYPLKASGRVGVGTTGAIEFTKVTGKGQGYRAVPEIRVRSSQGYGASVTALMGTNAGTTVGITTAIYNQITGIATFTTAAAHGFDIDDRVRITGAGFTFTPLSATRNISYFGYDYLTGIASIRATGGHYIGTGTNQSRSVLLAGVDVSNGITTYRFREDAYPIVNNDNANEVRLYTGVSTQPLTYEGGGTVRAGVDTAILEGKNIVGFDILGVTTNTFKCFVGVSSFAHNYVTGGVVERTEAGIITAFSIVEGGSGYFKPRTIAYLDGTPSDGITTITAHGDELGISTSIANVYYNPSTGIATIQSQYAHGLTVDNAVRLAGIAFSTPIGDITFPSDARKVFGVLKVESNINFQVNIGAGMTTTGIHTHHQGIGSYIPLEGHGLSTDDFIEPTGTAVTFGSSPAVEVTRVIYDNVSGMATVLTKKNHNLVEDDCVVFSGIAFTCDYSPRLNLSNAEYDNTTGVMTVTTAAPHGFKVGKDVVLTGIGMTCEIDAGVTTHYYPRRKSSTYNTSVPITGTTSNTFTAQVGYAPPQDQFAHTFVTGLTGGLIFGGDYAHTFIRASDGAVRTGGDFEHKFVTSTSNAIFRGGAYTHKYVSSLPDTIIIGGAYNHTFVAGSENTDCISVVGGSNTTPTAADYNPLTGDLTLTVNGHGLSGPSVHSVTTSRYNAVVGILTVTVPSHGFSNGDTIKIIDNSIGFKCSMDGYASTHTYPRSTDPISDKWVPVQNKTTDTFEIFVGKSPLVNHTVTDASYTPSTGIMTMTIGNHDLLQGNSIKIAANSLNFKCEMDGKQSIKTYPRTTDPVYDTAVPITGVGDTTISVNVGISTIVKRTPVFVHYTPSVGIMTVVLDTVSHGIIVGDSVKFKPGSLAFTCLKDANTTVHFYPRPTDPYYDKAVPVTGVAGTMFTVNIGQTSAGNFTHTFVPNQGVANDAVITGGDYQHEFTGVSTDAVISGGNYSHTFESATTGGLLRSVQKVGIASGSLVFKCAKDAYATEHAYPRESDPVYGQNIGITTVSTNTFTVRVGVSTIQKRSISTSTYDPLTGDLVLTVGSGHTYTSTSSHTITTATYTPSTGVLEPTIASHGFKSGEYVKFDDGAITFKCAEDGGSTNHPYPRPSDPYSNQWLPIYNVGVNTFSVFVGVSTNTTAHTFVSGTTGGVKKASDTIGINTGSITFTCSRDEHRSQHSYPRPTDPYGGNLSVGIGSTSATTLTVNVGISTIQTHAITTSTYTPSTGELVIESPRIGEKLKSADYYTIDMATYNGATGIITCTIPDHKFTTGDRVRFAPNSIRFTCSMDGKSTIHSYPRSSDPVASKWVPVFDTTQNTFSCNVGVSSIIPYSPTGGSYDPATGHLTLTIGSHKVRKGQSVKLKTRAFKFTCAKDAHTTNHFYPRATALKGPDPAYNTAVKVVGTTATDIIIDVGTSSNLSEHIFISASANSVYVGGDYDHVFYNADADGLAKANGTLGISTDGMTFTCAQDAHATNHTYPRTGYAHTFVSANSGAILVDGVYPHQFSSALAGALEFGGDFAHTYVSSLTGAAFTGGNYAHTFVAGSENTDAVHKGSWTGTKLTPTNAAYTPSTGNLVLTFASAHGLIAGSDTVGIKTDSLTFTCTRDGNVAEKTYPRTTDPIHGLTNVAIGATTVDTITINVGVSNIVTTNISTATYIPSTGVLTITVPSGHGLTTNDTIGIATGGITFTCARDNHSSQHAYPRTTDPHHKKEIAITGVTATTISCNVGVSTLQYAGVTTAVYDGATGIMTMTVDPATVALAVDSQLKVGIVTSGITFKCGRDNYASDHAYPRATDPYNAKVISIASTTANSITVNVGAAGSVLDVSAASYTGITGILTLTSANHALVVGDNIGIATNSLIFTCAKDGHASNHSYPRTTDPIHNKNVAIGATTQNTITLNVGKAINTGDPIDNQEIGIKTHSTNSITLHIGVSTIRPVNVTNATYTPSTGWVELTTDDAHGVDYSRSVGIVTNSLTYTCAMDDNATEHSYPRTTDPAHNAKLVVDQSLPNTLKVNVGTTTAVPYTASAATYNEVLGIMTMTVGAGHSFTTGTNFKFEKGALTFTCTRDGNVQAHAYPKKGDPWFDGTVVTRVINNTKVEMNVGVSTVPTYYKTGGTIQGAIIAPRLVNNSLSGSDYASGGTFVDKILSPNEYVVNVGISTCVHHYNRGGQMFQGKRITSSTGDGYSGVDVLEKLDGGSVRVNLGITTEYFNFKRGGRIDKPIFLDVTEPDPYFNKDLEYVSGGTGIGTNAVVSLRVNVNGNIGQFDLTEEGVGYKVTDQLTVAGLSSDPRVGVLTAFQLEVTELDNDKFSSFYMGQFILFDNISSFFNGLRKKFTLSVTTGGTTEILSLKTLPGSDMDITNNIFIYMNDILQDPQFSYTFKGSRIIFTEPPKAGSKCSIFYFRGSKRDVETVEPPLTVKAGDIVQIKENKFDLTDVDQFERTGKRIVASDVLETFAYDSIGINTDQLAERPITWEKQKRDKVVSGVLISKARPSLKAKVLPTTRIIRNVGASDNVIWVNNAYPVFSDIDLLTQSERNAQIFEDYDIEPGIVTSLVSTSSSISSLSISYGGTGYQYISNPVISISNSTIKKKDIIKDWKFDGITGVTDTVEWQAFTEEEPIIAVGSSSRYINTKSGEFWERGNIGFGGTVTFNSVGVGWTYTDPNDVYVVAAGDFGSLARGVSIGNSITSWQEMDLKEERQVPALNLTVVYVSEYAGSFNDVIWEGTRDTWVAVGAAGSIFTAVGVKSDAYFSRFSNTVQDLNSVVYAQNEFVAVGNGGAVIASNDGNIWSPKQSNTNYNLNDIIYDGNRFITVGDNGTIGVSSDKNYWQPWSQQQYNNAVHPATFDFRNLKYIDGIYIGISTTGNLYYSFDLINWNSRVVSHPNSIKDLVATNFGPSQGRRVIAVGSGTTAFYADPVINRATATASVTAGVITSVTINDGGFGYDVGSSPPVIVAPDKTKREDILSLRTRGDFGTIVGINTWMPGIGVTVPPRLEFTLKSNFNDNTNLGYGYSSLNALGINYSQLQKDDYFIVYDSPCVVGHALTGITTAIGGINNYPLNKVGIVSAGDNLGGIFRVEYATTGDAVSGLVTVTCAFQPGPNNNSDIQVGFTTSSLIDTFYGKYTWGQIYGYQNRGAGAPKEFFVNPDNGLTGLSTAAVVSRKKPLT